MPIDGDTQDANSISTLVTVNEIPSGADEIVTVDGDSMEPDYPLGSKIYLHYQTTIESGELAVVHVQDEGVTFKQIYIDEQEQTITLHSLNDIYEDRIFKCGEISIIGKVID